VCRGRFGLLLLLLMFTLSSMSYAVLPKPVSKALSRYKIAETSVSAVVVALDSKQPLLLHDAKRLRNPASVMKLLTTFAALEILGPAYTWKTEYYINGTLKDGVLDGDLLIKGGGDPYLVKERFWLQLVALREMGLQTIKGDLLIDNSAFDLPEFDRAKFDQQPTRLYNVGPSATLVNFNASRFGIRPGAGKVEILLDPPLENVIVENHLKAAKGKCRGAQSGWSVDISQQQQKARVVFRGKYRSRCGDYNLMRSVLDSDRYLYGLFSYLWRGLGGTFEGRLRQATLSGTFKKIYTGVSRPLSEVIVGTNKFSNNLLARQLLLSVGQGDAGEGATVQDGIDAIQSWLQEQGLDMPGLVMENGAGLSRTVQLSADDISRLLKFAANSADHPEFMASFALGGVDGTMKKRLKTLRPGTRARLKTGYVKGTRTLAGYVRADSGRDYAIVLFIEDAKVNYGNGNEVQDAFIRWVLTAG